MIIDVHYHYMPRLSERIATELAQSSIRSAKRMGRAVDPEAVIKKAVETWSDPTGEFLIAAMEESGVDLTVICMVDNSNNTRLTAEIMQGLNKATGEVAKRYPDKVKALAGVDPRRPEARDMMKQCFEEFGVIGLKYHPDDGYDPSGPESYKVLEVVSENNGILLSHTSPLSPPSRPKFADPMLLADLGVDFPNIKVIAAHMGYVDWRPWAGLALQQPNMYGDMAMWVTFAFGQFNRFCHELRGIIDLAGGSKVLFGTDDPLYNVVAPTREFIRLLKDLPSSSPEGVDFTHEEMDAILGGNAARILGLEV